MSDIIRCPVCGAGVSHVATACYKCGTRLPDPPRRYFWVAIIVAVLVAIGMIGWLIAF